MTEEWRAPRPGEEDGQVPLAIDTTVAHSARVYDYWLGGKDNYPADREAAEQVMAVRPALRRDIRLAREFLIRVVRVLAAEHGIRQFLDIGTGIPTSPNIHEAVQDEAPDARVVYVDNDPIVLAHARALMTSTPEGVTGYLHADMRQPGDILRQAARLLDFSLPVAVILAGVLHLVPDDEDPYAIPARLAEAAALGSYLVVSHPASDINPEVMAESQRRYNQHVVTRQTRRSRAEVARFLDGLEILPPGMFQPHRWRLEHAPGADVSMVVPNWAGIGRKA